MACQFAEAQASNLKNVTKFACASASLSTRSFLCHTAQRLCWGKNVKHTCRMTAGNKLPEAFILRWVPPAYLDSGPLWILLLCQLLWVSPSCLSPTNVTVHPALPASSRTFAFLVILPLKPNVCICRLFSCCSLTTKNHLIVLLPLSKIIQPWEICCNFSHLSSYIFRKPIKPAFRYQITTYLHQWKALFVICSSWTDGLMENWSFLGFIDPHERILW